MRSLTLGASPMERAYAANLASALLIAESSSVDMVFSASFLPYSRQNTLFTLDDCTEHHLYSGYEVMSAYADVLALGKRAYTSQDFRREAYILASTSDAGSALLLVTREFMGSVAIEIKGTTAKACKIKGIIGGGKRGAGYITEREGIPLGQGTLALKVGKNEVYLITL